MRSCAANRCGSLNCPAITETALIWLNQANRYTAMVLPPAVCATIALLIVLVAMEQGNVWQSRLGVWRSIYIPGWLAGGIVVAATIGATASVTYSRAHRYPFTANAATIAGIATACALMWWPTQQCNQAGGITAGIVVACMVIVVATVVNSQAGKVRRGIAIDDGALVDQPNSNPEAGRIGIVPFLQISLAAFMAVVLLIAFTNPDLADARIKLLTFAGIGITAASVISAERSLRSILAAAGAIVSVIGAYLEMEQSLSSSNGDIGALTIIIAAGLIAGIVVMFFSFNAHVVVRLLVTPILAALAVAGVTHLIIMVPVIPISIGCSVPTVGVFISVLSSGLLAIIAGSATFAVLIGVAATDLWKSRRAERQEQIQ